MAGVGGMQTIGGTNYEMYTPAWYQARDQNQIHQSQVNGAASGKGLGSAWDSLPASLRGLIDPSGSSSSSSSSAAFSVPGVGDFGWSGLGSSDGPAAVKPVAPVDLTSANSAAFATAKDQAAQTARASLDALSGELASRGMGGAGYEAGQIGGNLSREANTIGAASRAEAINEASLRADENKTNYEGSIAQRGQDISAAGQRLSAGVATRGQDISAAEENARLAQTRQLTLQQLSSDRLKMILGALGGFGGGERMY